MNSYMQFLESLESSDPHTIGAAKAAFEGIFGKKLDRNNPDWQRNRYGEDSPISRVPGNTVGDKKPDVVMDPIDDDIPETTPIKRVDWPVVMGNLRAYGRNTDYPAYCYRVVELAAEHHGNLGTSIEKLEEGPLVKKIMKGGLFTSPETQKLKYLVHIDRVGWWLDQAEKMGPVDFALEYISPEVAERIRLEGWSENLERGLGRYAKIQMERKTSVPTNKQGMHQEHIIRSQG